MKKKTRPDIMLADACSDNDVRLIQRCLAEGAGAGALGKRSGKCALAGVVFRQSQLGLEALLSKGGVDWEQGWGESVSPVVEAVKHGWIGGAGTLMSAGFDGTGAAFELTMASGCRRDLEFLLSRYRPSRKELDGCVEVAALQGRGSMVQMLLEYGASPDVKSESGSPLALRALRVSQLGVAIHFARAKANPLLADCEGRLDQAWSVHVDNQGELGDCAREMVARGRSAIEAHELAAVAELAEASRPGKCGGRI